MNIIKGIKGKVGEAVSFFAGSREEISKVSWPSKEEISRFTMVTVITTLVVAMFLWAVDLGLSKLIQTVIR